MSSHADTIRSRLLADPSAPYGHDDALEALAALVSQNRRLLSALESIAWGYTGGASAKTLGEIAGKALTREGVE